MCKICLLLVCTVGFCCYFTVNLKSAGIGDNDVCNTCAVLSEYKVMNNYPIKVECN